jgi:hypothetical protein
MKTYNYSVRTFFEDATITVETDNLNRAIGCFMEGLSQDLSTDIVDNRTGEVLALHSDERDFCAEEILPAMVECALSALLDD